MCWGQSGEKGLNPSSSMMGSEYTKLKFKVTKFGAPGWLS